MRSSHTILFAAVALMAVPASAAPDITGMWNYRYSEWSGGKAAPAPVLTPAAAALMARKAVATTKGYVRSINNMKCLPPGFPGMMLYRTPIEIMQGFGRISITAESSVEPRTIYLGKPQDQAADPSWNGHSVGHWSGDTLVVDTIGLNGRGGNGLWNIGAHLPPSTAGTHYTERFKLEPGNKTLSVTFTAVDPAMLATSYSVTVHYDRMPDDSERMEAVCEVDLDALKSVDLQSIKDVDDEAARMLDPDKQYNADENAEHKP